MSSNYTYSKHYLNALLREKVGCRQSFQSLPSKDEQDDRIHRPRSCARPAEKPPRKKQETNCCCKISRPPDLVANQMPKVCVGGEKSGVARRPWPRVGGGVALQGSPTPRASGDTAAEDARSRLLGPREIALTASTSHPQIITRPRQDRVPSSAAEAHSLKTTATRRRKCYL